MSNFQYTLSVKNVFNNIKKQLKESVIIAQDETKDEIEALLRTAYKYGGFSAYDYFRKYYTGKAKTKEHHYNLWTVRNRNGSLEIRNRASYARALYTAQPSRYHKDGYRSALPHAPMYITIDSSGKKVMTYRKPTRKKYTELIPGRDEQITKKRYEQIQKEMIKIANRNIKKQIGKINSVTSTYKG